MQQEDIAHGSQSFHFCQCKSTEIIQLLSQWKILKIIAYSKKKVKLLFKIIQYGESYLGQNLTMTLRIYLSEYFIIT